MHFEGIGESWNLTERLTLPGYESEKVIGGNGKQEIMLRPVTICYSDNSWYLDFTIEISGVGTQEEPRTGTRHRVMNLHTSNYDLAVARAQQSMGNAEYQGQDYMGFVDRLKHVCAQCASNDWVHEPRSGGNVIRFSPQWQILDVYDQMLRYEDDIGVSHSLAESATPGHKTIELKLLRGCTPDLTSKVLAAPEPVMHKRQKTDLLKVPATFSFDIPESEIHKAEEYVAAVVEVLVGVPNGTIREHYSSIAIPFNDDLKPKPKRVPDYNTSGVVRMFEAAAKDKAGEFFALEFVRSRDDVRNEVKPER
jgi:hypothetical protein